MKTYILYIENCNGITVKTEVEAESSQEAVNSFLDGKWRKMTNNEIPTGVRKIGTYSFKKGYVTVKKPNRIFDWFKKVN